MKILVFFSTWAYLVINHNGYVIFRFFPYFLQFVHKDYNKSQISTLSIYLSKSYVTWHTPHTTFCVVFIVALLFIFCSGCLQSIIIPTQVSIRTPFQQLWLWVMITFPTNNVNVSIMGARHTSNNTLQISITSVINLLTWRAIFRCTRKVNPLLSKHNRM